MTDIKTAIATKFGWLMYANAELGVVNETLLATVESQTARIAELEARKFEMTDDEFVEFANTAAGKALLRKFEMPLGEPNSQREISGGAAGTFTGGGNAVSATGGGGGGVTLNGGANGEHA